MARASYRAEFTVQGHPFHVRRDHILVVGTSTSYETQPDGSVLADAEPIVATLITVKDVGNIPVEESLDEALAVWDGLDG